MYFRLMNQAVLLLGTNQGDRRQNLLKAITLIEIETGKVTAASGIYETAAWGDENQDAYYNQVLVTATQLEAGMLMQALLNIEKEMGRTRLRKWEPRIIDIDILFFNSDVIREKDLTIPHPLLQDRRFTLIPLAEVLPDFIHPLLKKSTEELLELCFDKGEVKIVSST
jgi:2-amino-4-hydroxy-6-hydroxymethyldihydropteridine diphosphokinase